MTYGGDNSKANVVPACGRCNMRKGNKTLAEYVASRIVLTERGLI
jgi:5-methylcytosine-specific restriction endonuclease McrA